MPLLLTAKYQLSKCLLKCQPSLYSPQLSLTYRQHGDTSVAHQAFESGSRGSPGLLRRHSTYLVPAYECVPGLEGSWQAAHRCWRQYHNPAGPEHQGWLCLWRSGTARRSSGSRIGRTQKQNTLNYIYINSRTCKASGCMIDFQKRIIHSILIITDNVMTYYLGQ